jgi:hypothetical protein
VTALRTSREVIVFLEPERCETLRERSSIVLPPSNAAGNWFGCGERPALYLQVALSVKSCTVTVPFAFAVMCARKCS